MVNKELRVYSRDGLRLYGELTWKDGSFDFVCTHDPLQNLVAHWILQGVYDTPISDPAFLEMAASYLQKSGLRTFFMSKD